MKRCQAFHITDKKQIFKKYESRNCRIAKCWKINFI